MTHKPQVKRDAIDGLVQQARSFFPTVQGLEVLSYDEEPLRIRAPRRTQYSLIFGDVDDLSSTYCTEFFGEGRPEALTKAGSCALVGPSMSYDSLVNRMMEIAKADQPNFQNFEYVTLQRSQNPVSNNQELQANAFFKIGEQEFVMNFSPYQREIITCEYACLEE